MKKAGSWENSESTIAHFITESANEIGKRFLEMKPLPDFVQMIGPNMYPDENEGITAITIFKYDKTKAGDANEAIANLYNPSTHSL